MIRAAGLVDVELGSPVDTFAGAGGKITINVSKQDVAEIEAASNAKGCHIDFRGFTR